VTKYSRGDRLGEMVRMNGDVLERFISETVETFKFLEVEYGYRMVSKEIENKNYFPDAEAVVRYADSRIGIEVFWYFASSIIGVAFMKLQNGRFPDGRSKDALVINLYDLAGSFQRHLREDKETRKDNKREYERGSRESGRRCKKICPEYYFR
jgi:hypothetical protein